MAVYASITGADRSSRRGGIEFFEFQGSTPRTAERSASVCPAKRILQKLCRAPAGLNIESNEQNSVWRNFEGVPVLCTECLVFDASGVCKPPLPADSNALSGIIIETLCDSI